MQPAPLPPVTWIEIFSILSGVSSLILAIVAIWLSLYFYDKSKTSERLITGALEAIKAQTDAFQRLTGRWMDRLTRYATEPRPADETLVVLLQAFREMPANLAIAFRGPTQDANVLALRRRTRGHEHESPNVP